MTSRPSTYPLSLPVSTKNEAKKLAAAAGTSLNELVVSAVAAKVAALRTASAFAERRGRADWEAFDRLMSRSACRRQVAEGIIGASSSHTVGLMEAALAFAIPLNLAQVAQVRVRVFSSPAWPGHGPATDKAVILGLAHAVSSASDP
jgi:hypothetical protein